MPECHFRRFCLVVNALGVWWLSTVADLLKKRRVLLEATVYFRLQLPSRKANLEKIFYLDERRRGGEDDMMTAAAAVPVPGPAVVRPASVLASCLAPVFRRRELHAQQHCILAVDAEFSRTMPDAGQ